MSKGKILYTTHINATFIAKDTEFLQEKYHLVSFNFHIEGNFQIPFLFIKQFLFLLLNISRCNLLICQFAGYHSLLPAFFAKLFRKPCIIVACGTDCYSFPSIKYGNFRKKILGMFTRFTYQFASHIVPVDESLIFSESTYYNVDYPKQGIKFFCKELAATFRTICNGYDTKLFSKAEVNKKPFTFITIGKLLETSPVFYRKGIDLILAIAPKFSLCTFTIVGMNNRHKMPKSPNNVIYIEYLESKELIKMLSEHTFYLQLSIAEGFPNALCEAMLCECVPIGSDVAAIPKIIGDTGFILQKKDELELTELINMALISDVRQLGTKARSRIIENFGIDKRSDSFYELIDSIIH